MNEETRKKLREIARMRCQYQHPVEHMDRCGDCIRNLACAVFGYRLGHAEAAKDLAKIGTGR